MKVLNLKFTDVLVGALVKTVDERNEAVGSSERDFDQTSDDPLAAFVTDLVHRLNGPRSIMEDHNTGTKVKDGELYIAGVVVSPDPAGSGSVSSIDGKDTADNAGNDAEPGEDKGSEKTE